MVATAVGSLQDKTFFRRYIGSGSDQPEILGNMVSGMTEEGTFWFVDGKALEGLEGRVQMSQIGATTNTRGRTRGAEGLLELRNVCWFGLRKIVPGSLTWNGDSFRASWHDSQWPLATNTSVVTGEVLGYTNNLPTAIRLESEAWPDSYRHILLHYEYDPNLENQFYPSKLITELVLQTGSIRDQWFENIRIEFGDAGPKGGFSPNDFLPSTNAAAPMVLIASNQDVYWDDGDGLKKVEPIQGSSNSSRGVRMLLITFFLGSLLILLIVIVRAFSRKYSRGKQHEKG